MPGIASFKAKLRRPTGVVAFSQTPVNRAAVVPSGTTGVFQVANAAFRRFDPNGVLFVEEQTNPGVWEEVYRTAGSQFGQIAGGNYVDYKVDNQLGILTRGSVLRSTSALGHTIPATPTAAEVRVNGGYLRMADLGGTNSFSLTTEISSSDVTETIHRNRNFDNRLRTGSVTFSRFHVPGGTLAQADFQQMLQEGTRLFVEITFDSSSDSYDVSMNPIPKVDIFQAWGILTGDEYSFNVEDSQMESVTVQLSEEPGKTFTRIMN